MIQSKINQTLCIARGLLSQSDNTTLQTAASVIQNDGIIAILTDTIYGISASALNDYAVKKVQKIKKRADTKPMIVLIGSWCMLKKYFQYSKQQEYFLRQLWINGERPTTVLLKDRKLLPKILQNKDGYISVRMPINNDFLINVIKKSKQPLISTSANLSGTPPLKSAKQIATTLGAQISLIINGGYCKKSRPSRVIDISDMQNIKIIRK